MLEEKAVYRENAPDYRATGAIDVVDIPGKIGGRIIQANIEMVREKEERYQASHHKKGAKGKEMRMVERMEDKEFGIVRCLLAGWRGMGLINDEVIY